MGDFNNFDDLFRDKLGSHEAIPGDGLWDRIEHSDIPSQLDGTFQGKLANMEVTPNDKVWENVQPHLPLHLGIRRMLNNLSKVAAVLLFGMLTYTCFHSITKPNVDPDMIAMNQVQEVLSAEDEYLLSKECMEKVATIEPQNTVLKPTVIKKKRKKKYINADNVIVEEIEWVEIASSQEEAMELDPFYIEPLLSDEEVAMRDAEEELKIAVFPTLNIQADDIKKVTEGFQP